MSATCSRAVMAMRNADVGETLRRPRSVSGVWSWGGGGEDGPAMPWASREG